MIEAGRVLQQRYHVERQIGQGGMGAVYVATDERFGSTVAIKETLCMDDNFRKAIEREARLLNSLKHNSLPRVTDHFEEDNILFIVMEYIPGDDVAVMLENGRGAFALDKVLQWADQLLDALDYLHNQELPVIHRDIKPQNLKINSRGEMILLDFGLAKGNPADSGHQTAAKSIFGYSRNYASLEQIQGTGTDPRSDLYSLAATLYHMLTGIPPEDALTRAMSVLSKKPDPMLPANVANPEVPRGVAALLHQALDLNAGERPPTARRFQEMLREHEKYADLLERWAADQVQIERDVHGQQTRLMHDATRADGNRQTEVKTRIMSPEHSEVTSVASSSLASGSANPGASPLLKVGPKRSRRFAIGGAALALVLAGIAISGVLYAVDPTIFGAAGVEDTPADQPVVDNGAIGNADANAASANSDVQVDVPAVAGTDITAAPVRDQNRTANKPGSAKAQAAARSRSSNAGEDPSFNFEMDDAGNPRHFVITERRSDGTVKVTKVDPNVQRPGFDFNPFPNGFDQERLTPEQREKIREAMRKFPKAPIVKPPPTQP